MTRDRQWTVPVGEHTERSCLFGRVDNSKLQTPCDLHAVRDPPSNVARVCGKSPTQKAKLHGDFPPTQT